MRCALLALALLLAGCGRKYPSEFPPAPPPAQEEARQGPLTPEQRKAVAERAARGSQAVPRIVQESLARPGDREELLMNIAALRRMGTPEAEQALERLRREVPDARRLESVLDGEPPSREETREETREEE